MDDVDAQQGAPIQAQVTKTVATSIPTHVRFRGCPARRYWDLEDAAVNWAAIGSGPGDVARLVTVELALAFADHWLQVPLVVPPGAISRITSLVVADAFGVRTLVRSAADLDAIAGHSTWRFCELTHKPKVSGQLVFIPPAASPQLVGPTVEAIELARDDVGDVLWAIDRTLRGADGRPRRVTTPAVPSTPVVAPTYRVGPDVPATRRPYRARAGTDGIELARATVPGAPPLADRPDLPATISIAAAPASPAQIRSFYTLARSSDGAYHLVLRRRLDNVAPSPGFSLDFDQVLG